MEREQEESVPSSISSSSTRKLVKRSMNWEISDSEDEEEPSGAKTGSYKIPVVKVEIPKGVEDDEEHLPATEANSSHLAVPLPISTTPSPTKRMRKKKSPEEQETELAHSEERKKEIENKKQEKAQKKNLEKTERELKKQEKERKKELEKAEREAKRQETEKRKGLEKMETEKRKKAALALKLLRPDQCVKYMTVQVDAGILEDAGSEDLFEALRSAGYNYSIEPQPVPWSFTWRREMPLDWTCVDGLELRMGQEDQMLVLIQPKDFLGSVGSFAEVPKSSRAGGHSMDTVSSIFGIPTQHPQMKITMVVLGFHDYRWCQKLSRQMERQSLEQREECGREPSESFVTRHQIAEVRKHWEAQTFSFCTSAGSWRGWGPKGSLSGLPLVWRRQIQQLNRVSPAMAAAVTQVYASPQALMKAYAACNTERERMLLLSDLRVPREHHAGATENVCEDVEYPRDAEQTPGKERRIGPDISRRIWLCMTTTNPELVLDLNSP
ncbi:putative crossover junction endonuclease EME2 isoform 2-T2 [Discoglossus pictus]